MIQRGALLWVMVGFFLSCLAYGVIELFHGGHAMQADAAVKLKTICFGRYLIDMPEEMVVSYPSLLISGWQIHSNKNINENEFVAQVDNKEIELRDKQNSRSVSSLEEVRKVDNPHMSGKIFLFDRRWNYRLESGRRIDFSLASILAMVRINNVNYTIFRRSGDKKGVDEIAGILQKMRYREPDEIPAESGFCFQNGFIADPRPGRIFESSVFFAGFESRPDLSVLVTSSAGSPADGGLLARAQRGATRRAYPDRFKTIFEGRREINGITGEEASDQIRELNGTTVHNFMWESDAHPDDSSRPTLTLELTTGRGPSGPVGSSLSTQEAQELWKTISSSLRPRPVRVIEQNGAMEDDSPPPKIMKAGQPCPTTGWWSCAGDTAGYQVLGGATQFLSKGVQMPQAQLFSPTTFLDRVKKHQPTFTLSTPTVWELTKEQS